MAHDKRFRESVLKFIDNGHTIREASKVFEISPTTIMNWRKLRKETGVLSKRQVERKHKKIDPVKLLTYYKNNPDSYLTEAAEHFGCSNVAIFKAKKRLGITRKKN
jgi:transposase